MEVQQMVKEVLANMQYVNKLADYKPGTPLMLECFATWCPPCRAAAPHLAQLTKEYPGVYIVSLSREEAPKVQKLKDGLTPMRFYNVGVETSGALQRLMDAQGVEGIPHAFIFDAAGKIVFSGHPKDAECEETLQALNAE